MTDRPSGYGTSVQASLWFGLGLVVVVVLAITILALPISAFLRVSALTLLLVFILGVAWHRQYVDWELHAKRQTIAAISILGTLMLAKAGVSQIAQRIDLIGELSDPTNGAASISVAVLLGVAGTPWQMDIAFAILGLAALFLALHFLRSNDAGPRGEIRQPSPSASSVPVYLTFAATNTYDSDLPPLVETWVGREQELKVLDEISNGVVAITGIGGQGKSALAATFLKNLRNRRDLFWDWRDCREQADRFRLQLMSVIQHATHGDVTPSQIADAHIGWLSRFFFKTCGQTRSVIVFDNVDHYVDVAQSLFTSTVSTFVNEALRVDHQLLIVLTCRPRISYASVRFREIYLRGLDANEALSLFDQRIPGGLREDKRSSVKRIHELTEGHPLWLNIIAAQIARKPQSESQIVGNLEVGNIDDRSGSMLQSIWNALNDRQRAILMSMAELPRALEADLLFQYLGGRVGNHNRFDRAFRGLQAISLITEKTTGGQEASRFELHPMVRAFVRKGYRNSAERKENIGSLLSCCEVIIARLSDQDGSHVSITLLENKTTMAELQLEMHEIEACVRTLVTTFDQMVVNGIADEFVRIAKLALDKIDRNNQSALEDETLDSLMEKLARIMVEMGMLERLTPYLDRYTALVTQGTARHIGLCNIRTYVAWFSGNFDEAIEWGELGEREKQESGLDTDNDASHNLALARRDSGDIHRALKYLTTGLPLKKIFKEDHRKSQRDYSFYGNIGRCLALRGDSKKALHLYAKAYDLILRSGTSQRQQLNLGYAAYWIAEAFDSLGEKDEAQQFYQHASNIWRRRAPKRAEAPNLKLAQMTGTHHDKTEAEISAWCHAYVAKLLEPMTDAGKLTTQKASSYARSRNIRKPGRPDGE